MVEALHSAFGGELSWPPPRGGFFLWAALPPGVDGDRLIPRAIEHGVIYVAGEAFFVNGAGQNLIRLSFSSPSPDRIREGVARLAAAVREERASLTGPEAGSSPAGRAAP
jgi:DNA-binding transcriptional MocR family regulator